MGVVILATLTGNQLIHLQIPNLTVLLLCAILVLLNAPLHYYFFVIKKKKDTHLDSKLADRFTYFQLAIDWIFLTLLFHYTGGIASPLLFYLLFHVVLSGVLLKRWVCLLYNTLIALTINLLALMELGGVISHIYGASFISRDVQKNPFFVLLLLFFFTAVLYISSSFVALLLERLRERLRGVKAIQHKLEQDNKELRSLNQLYRGISSTLGLSPRLDFICKSIMEVMGVKGVAIRLIDEKTNRLELASATGLSEAYLNKGPVDADKSLVKALEGEPHFVLDASTDPAVQYPEEARKEGIVSMLAFPLKGRERLIGTLRLYTDKRRYFSQYERGFLSALSSQAAIFIENAKIQDALERQDEAKSEFIMSMTHELKGPLMAIQSIVDVMLKGYVGSLVEKQRELISRIYKRIDSVMEISGGLLDIYQWQSRRPDVKQVPLSIKEQIQRAVDLFKASAQEKGLNLTGALPDEDLILMGTEDEMEKILNNLITNAIKYTPSGGSILLEPSTSESHLILRVKDTGIGIPEDDIPKIFEESFRTKEAKKIDPYGKGLGLHFVKKVVETLGGSIRVKSDKGKGTEFILAFPKA
ncbi:MAG: GAF domain-containing sensor histidine kinase [Deltaproteobacteria bacterium]|nr:MAG: GAF domain-containing sensor histidine kinase [Deltaproteobacteria bacterium]